MKVFVFTYDRYESISTPSLLESSWVEHFVLCHSEEAKKRFIDAGRVSLGRLIATGQPKGLANNRNAALEMMKEGEWAVFLVDDLKHVTELADYDKIATGRVRIDLQNYKKYRLLFKKRIDLAKFMHRAEETRMACEAVGAKLGGFSGTDAPLYRDSKWKFNALADGRAWVIQKSKLRFDAKAQLIDDLCWTARNIQAFGAVVVNQWVLPECRRFTAGAYGSIQERMPQKMIEARHLVENYPGFICYGRKAGWPSGSHVVLRRTLNNEQIKRCEAVAVNATRGYRNLW